MTYEGFLRIGGVEVVNTERARGYTTTTDCPERLVDSRTECLTLGDAMGDASYDFADINDAPWYDVSLADMSSRFYGVVGLNIAGVTDSTRGASRTEGVTDGGVVGRTRKGMRGVRVRATLMARGRDALDYGSQWLSSVFDGNCSQHGDACSTTDAEFLAECPPPRGTVPDFTAWGTARTNLMVNPKPTAYAGSQWAQPSTGSITADGVTSTLTSTTTPYIFTAPAQGGAVLGRVYAFRAKVRASFTAGSAATNVLMRPHKRVGNAYYALTPAITVPADGVQHEIYFYWRATVDIANNDGFELSGVANGTALSGSTLSFDDVLIEDVGTDIPTTPPAGFFYGNTPMAPDQLTRYIWSGTVGNSTSLMQTRTIIDRPRTDEEYAAFVDPLRRFLHDISVTSGPIDVEEFEPSTGFYGKTVEFTLTSERAWVYGLTRTLTLAPTLPSVVQDIPYNLIPYPSAELAAGLITVATNISTNPSVETNATGWVQGIGGAITAPMLASGRVVNELSASGTGSFRVVFTATGASAVAGEFTAQQVIAVNTLAAGTRVSVGLWAAEVLMAGSPVRLPIILEAVWMDGASAVLRTDLLGTVPVNGGSASLTGLTIPAGALAVLVRARARLSSWDAATIVRLYVDALSVTVP